MLHLLFLFASQQDALFSCIREKKTCLLNHVEISQMLLFYEIVNGIPYLLEYLFLFTVG